VGTLIGQGIIGSGAYEWVALVGSVLLIPILILNSDGLAAPNIKAVKAVGARLATRTSTLPGRSVVARQLARRRRPARVESKAPASGGREGSQRHIPVPLTFDSVSVSFGGIKALSNVSLSVQPGEIVGLIGPNGAGKTTAIDVIAGFVDPDSGTIEFGDQRIESWSAYRRARAGIARTFQGLELFEDLTVLDNLRSAADGADKFGYLSGLVRADEPSLSEATLVSVREFGLEGHLDDVVRELPYGLRRLVGIARAVAADPAVLLLDEPTAGLDERESREVAEILRTIPMRRGIGVLLVEHDMSVILSLCTRVVVLDFGVVIAEGTPDGIRRDPRVVAAYLGPEIAGSQVS
jgi:sulfate-transporting ATPase